MFERPKNLATPTVYYTFKANDKDNKNVIEYRVQDLTEEFYEQALENIGKFYLPEENFAVCNKVAENPEAVEEFFNLWRNAMKQKVSLACFTNDGSEELVAVNILFVKCNDDPPRDMKKFKTKEIQGVLSTLSYVNKQFNVFDTYNVDKNLTGFGLTVNHEYRGKGIATEVLKARISLMKAIGVNLTSTYYTAVGSQAAAAKAGYKESFVISFEDLGKHLPDLDFSKSNAKYLKTMDVKI